MPKKHIRYRSSNLCQNWLQNWYTLRIQISVGFFAISFNSLISETIRSESVCGPNLVFGSILSFIRIFVQPEFSNLKTLCSFFFKKNEAKSETGT